jgi:biotin-dependent carboxylase-like uncharacterized protein
LAAVIEVLAVHGLTTVQDLGRPGWMHLGVSPSGAADRSSYLLANRLVGNERGAACLEVTFGGLELRLHRPAVVSLTGAPCPVVVRNGPPMAVGTRAVLPAGAELGLGRPTQGLRTYLAVRGGIDVQPVLGSRSTDTLGGLGPPAVTAGQTLGVGPEPPDGLDADFTPHSLRPLSPVRLWPGPRGDARLWEMLLQRRWTVGADSDRCGVRLDSRSPVPAPQPLDASEPLIPGAVQLPPDGRLIVFLVDHPTTGGYPVVGVVDRADLDLLAQARPGHEIRLAPVG